MNDPLQQWENDGWRLLSTVADPSGGDARGALLMGDTAPASGKSSALFGWFDADDDQGVFPFAVLSSFPVVVTSHESGEAVQAGTVVLKGTGEQLATVEVSIEGTKLGLATVDEDGNWGLEVNIQGSGKKNLDVVQTINGEVATATVVLDLGGDVTPPKPVIKCSAPRPVPVFADTPLSHKFYKEIDWMECMKYSTGWRQPAGKPLYKPADNLERQAMAAFIFRMEASKAYKAPAVSPFADVKPGDSFYKEMAWMYEKGYSTGWAEPSGKPTYRPHEPLSREAMAAFIYRLEASKDATAKSYKAPRVSKLADMKPGMKFYKEISWMYDTKLSTGNKVGSTKEYWPKDDLSRQAMAAFIYRLVTDYRAS
ncbi:carboxypeptidase-like regulatory domain-containing protein [Leucobacter coleopterorum]|uniref:Carboxypeptidase-like regulatory domain-containing protein n=1 Tax=Leucobacter coleopterorum TaxID=2714933 RepID=A0ABX6JTT4_9MICO|nr:S-layer homology domain-containing protein [Leucobacter coleopterorum]QIM17695.1 carboxypeptidase-like regulatory domain-containing protein [Leucobacter coleopterorum]